MKGFDKKGVSPVIATILLIALTVAAVGMVAVVLSTLSRPGVGINAMLAAKSVSVTTVAPFTTTIKLTNWGPDTIKAATATSTDGAINIEVEGTISSVAARGTASKLPEGGVSTVSVTWLTGTTNSMTAAVWPRTVGSGSELEIRLVSTTVAITPTKLRITDANTGSLIFSDESLPSPT